MWCEVSLIAPSHRTCKIWARIDLERSRLEAAHHTIPSGLSQRWTKLAIILFPFIQPYKLRSNLNSKTFETICVSIMDAFHIQKVGPFQSFISRVYYLLFVWPLWNERSRARKLIPSRAEHEAPTQLDTTHPFGLLVLRCSVLQIGNSIEKPQDN